MTATLLVRPVAPFCTRSWAAVTFFFLPPAAPSAFSAFCCSFFYSAPSSQLRASCQATGTAGGLTIDHIFNILGV